MMIKEILIVMIKYSYLQKKLFSFGYICVEPDRYLIASYIATENEYLVMVILAS